MKHNWPSNLPRLIITPEEEERSCPDCGRRMFICDHRFHCVETKKGPVSLCCKLLQCGNRSCPSSHRTFSPIAEQFIAPPKLAVDWELFAWIGHRRFARHWSVPTICAELADTFRVVFSWDSVEDYVHRYERMVAARHQDPAELEDAYANIADLVLSIDGLQPEKGHETLYVVRELNAGRVLFAQPLLSSATVEIEALLERAKQIVSRLGKPIRCWVSDKQEAFVTGIRKVFPGVPHRLCKIHFVRAIAKETRTKDSQVKVKLRKKVRGLRAIERAVRDSVRGSPAGTELVDPGAIDPATAVETSAPAPSEAEHGPCAVRENEAPERTPQGREPGAPEAARGLGEADPSGHQEATTEMDVVMDYCAATRGILNDDQGTALDPPGLRMARALREVHASLDHCLDAKKGGSARNC